MAFIPYSRQDINEDDIAAVTAALKSDFLTQGPALPAFETAFAERHQVSYAVAVANATAALHIACLALDIGKGSLVWTSPISFVASSNCALYVGADIDFVDIDPLTRNMSIDALTDKLIAAEKAGKLPDLIIPVDFSGLPCDLREMRQLADKYGFRILEDASHASGAEYLGKPVGSDFADATVFSFHAVKILTTAEGGMVTTQDAEVAKKLQLLRSHGITRDADALEVPSDGGWYYEQQILGFNYRMTELQAVLGSSQLNRLSEMQAERIARADKYDALFTDVPVKLPIRLNDRTSAWHLYMIELESSSKRSRAEVFAGMREAQIGVNVHYIPIHTQPYYTRLGFKKGDFPASENYYAQAITLPLFPAMTDDEQAFVVDTVKSLTS